MIIIWIIYHYFNKNVFSSFLIIFLNFLNDFGN